MEIRNQIESAMSFLRNLGAKKDEETIPFAKDAMNKNNGAISKRVTENGQITTKTAEKQSLPIEDKGPMSKSRKACFLLSFNVWIIYFAALLWLIPCHFSNCPGTKKWDITFSNIALATHLETIGKSVIFGYKNTSAESLVENQGMLLALNSINGDVIWSTALNSIPLQVHCGKSTSEAPAVCTAIDETKIVTFNSSNGDQLWEQAFISDSVHKENFNVLLCGSSETPISINRNFWIDTQTNQYKILDLDVLTKSVGMKYIDFPTDCDELYPKIKSINMNDFNDTRMVFVCTNFRSISLWTISSNDLCGNNTEENVIGKKFHHLYRINESILAENVLIADTERHAFVVSWSNALILVSKKTYHAEIWRHSFKNSSTVLSIVPGHFTSTEKDQIAVTTQDENRSVMVHILNLPDGSMVSSMFVDDRTVKSVSLISGEKDSKADLLLVETGTSNVTMLPDSYKIWEIPDVMMKDDFGENSVFHTINFGKKALVTRLILAPSLKSKAIIKDGKDMDLVVAERKFNSDLVIRNYILKSNAQKGCS